MIRTQVDTSAFPAILNRDDAHQAKAKAVCRAGGDGGRFPPIFAEA